MRLAGLSAAFIIAASFAAIAAAQNAPQTVPQTQGEVFEEGMTACAIMFSERHPAASLPSFPPSSSPFIDNGYGKERAAAYGYKPLPIEDLMKTGWEVQQGMLGQKPRTELAKRSAWGVARLTPSNLSCGVSMFTIRDNLLDGDLVLATAAAWIARTYPGASVEGEAEVRDKRFDLSRGGKPSGLTRTQWKAPDGMRVSLSITRPDGERGAFLVSMLMNYLPTKSQPAISPEAPT